MLTRQQIEERLDYLHYEYEDHRNQMAFLKEEMIELEAELRSNYAPDDA